MFCANLADEEVHRAVFDMDPWKAPGLDGFPAGFYQKSWKYIGKSVCNFIKSLWCNPNQVSEINLTDICLVPKVQEPQFVNQFRPISLCNTLYKILSKVIVNRLKGCIADIVSPYQTGFIPGRSIHENIVVAQEMIHSMNRANGRMGYFAIKVDLAKAYDKLSWNFIHMTLREVGIPVEMINVIMYSVRTVNTNVRWNDTRSEYFAPKKGLRQGDPISPYLFVICMDKLSHLICEAVEKGDWTAMKAGRNGPMVSHQMFADDLLLFGQATTSQMVCVREVLKTFCSLSGQNISNDKTNIFSPKMLIQSLEEC
jgi:hypothetical protein